MSAAATQRCANHWLNHGAGPELLRQQWIDEAQTHAPDLTVFNYVNHLQAGKAVPKGTTWTEFARKFHVIVASYETLKSEVRSSPGIACLLC